LVLIAVASSAHQDELVKRLKNPSVRGAVWMIHLLRSRASRQQLEQMLETLGVYLKLAVDIHRGTAAGGGALHADCEAVLLEDGSRQEDIWGADWIPSTQQIRYEALINIRPRQNNPSMTILDQSICHRVAEVVRNVLGGV
jgi:hypothetical protein